VEQVTYSALTQYIQYRKKEQNADPRQLALLRARGSLLLLRAVGPGSPAVQVGPVLAAGDNSALGALIWERHAALVIL